MPAEVIRISGARQHNLKNLHVEIPREKLVVITGLSGSGKSSLAFDTLYAEGQRRYVESLSAYARQFLDQMEKPDGFSFPPSANRMTRQLANRFIVKRPSKLSIKFWPIRWKRKSLCLRRWCKTR